MREVCPQNKVTNLLNNYKNMDFPADIVLVLSWFGADNEREGAQPIPRLDELSQLVIIRFFEEKGFETRRGAKLMPDGANSVRNLAKLAIEDAPLGIEKIGVVGPYFGEQTYASDGISIWLPTRGK